MEGTERIAMTERVTPMIHVPDVQATTDWYQGIGFTVNETYGRDGDGLSFAILSFGSTQVMFNQGGRPSSERRREVDLYVYTDDADEVYDRLKDRVEIVQGLEETFYGMREFVIRDLNRFWMTFGQRTSFGMLMDAVEQANTELAQKALSSGRLKPEDLTTALVAASARDENGEITTMLKRAGAVPPPELDDRILESYVGKYRSEEGMEAEILFMEGKLFAAPAGQQQASLIAIDENTFRPSIFKGVTLTFKVEDGKIIGFVFRLGSHATLLKRIE
jgi:uncharacterized glyoxalase superfamily protein PhnB